ncbi:MAG TPA: 3'-5' exonuclease [Solirubrobacteraceae bacterium]|jgi:DNA polymerase-3 subunit epsilon|nr:3'-5' exonuclease [Solirubrobacteraceae bacterium]
MRSLTLAQAAEQFRAGRPARGRTNWRDAEWLAVDLELTGLNPRRHEIVAIGAVPIRAGRVALGDCFYTLVRPDHPSEVEAVLVHKLRAEDLAGAPPLADALTLLLQRMTGTLPVFHTAAVERGFLGRQLRRLRLRLPAAADTEVLGKLWLRDGKGAASAGVPLTRLATLLGQRAYPPHHALGDALTTASVFIALASHQERAGQRPTVGSLQHAALRLGGGGRFGPI